MDCRDYNLLLIAMAFGIIVTALLKLQLKPFLYYPLLALAVLLLPLLFVLFLNRINDIT